MSLGLKIIMMIISVGTFGYFIRKIKKSQAQIVDMSFWVLFSLALIMMVLLPDVVGMVAELLGIATIINFVFLAVIFLLLLEVFLLCIKVSKLESKIIDLAGEIAIQNENGKESKTL